VAYRTRQGLRLSGDAVLHLDGTSQKKHRAGKKEATRWWAQTRRRAWTLGHMVDPDYLRNHYRMLDDQELLRLARGELVPEARQILDAEITARGMSPAARSPDSLPRASARASNPDPYSPPKALLVDPNAIATISVAGLVRLFQAMVVTSTVIGLFLFAWPYLPLPIADELMALRAEAGAGALAFGLSGWISLLLQPFWILSALGLFFFKSWARPVFVGTYALSTVASLLGGMAIWLPWETVLIIVATLLDGAILVLAFLPPLATYFVRDNA
jgi:hypothetical protein